MAPKENMFYQCATLPHNRYASERKEKAKKRSESSWYRSHNRVSKTRGIGVSSMCLEVCHMVELNWYFQALSVLICGVTKKGGNNGTV